MVPFLRKHLPSIFIWYDLIKLSFRESRWLPRYVTLTYSGNRIHTDPLEPRGRALLRNRGAGQPLIKRFWRTSIRIFTPEVVLDVGANYGEVFLDACYLLETKYIFVVEANPALIPHLNLSKNFHPSREKIMIVNGLASDNSGGERCFYVDKLSSGRSTALEGNFVRESMVTTVQNYRLDDLILNLNVAVSTVVFKIDVEGFEPFVLQGMSRLLESNISFVGCVEFNLRSLEINNIDQKKYFDLLNRNFFAAALGKDGLVIPIDEIKVELLKTHFSNAYTEGDILLFSTKDLRDRFMNEF